MRDLDEELLRSPHRANPLHYMSQALFICMQSTSLIVFTCLYVLYTIYCTNVRNLLLS